MTTPPWVQYDQENLKQDFTAEFILSKYFCNLAPHLVLKVTLSSLDIGHVPAWE